MTKQTTKTIATIATIATIVLFVVACVLQGQYETLRMAYEMMHTDATVTLEAIDQAKQVVNSYYAMSDVAILVAAMSGIFTVASWFGVSTKHR